MKQKVVASQYNRKDHLYKKAKEEGLNSRAAFKLTEIDKRFRILKKGANVLDLGCFPGGWVQVAAEKVGPSGKVYGIDLREVTGFENQPNIRIKLGDIYDPATVDDIRVFFENRPLDAVISDLSHQLTGIRLKDVVASAELLARAFELGRVLLKPGGSVVAKFFPGQDTDDLVKELRKEFTEFKRVTLDSSRKSSIEQYVVGVGFLPKSSSVTL